MVLGVGGNNKIYANLSYIALQFQHSFHISKHIIYVFIATLGSILDSQLSWESGKFQLARWSQEVALFPVNTTHPPTRPPAT